MKTSTARAHGWTCPECGDATTQDHAKKGFVSHKNNRSCTFEKGQRDTDTDTGPTKTIDNKQISPYIWIPALAFTSILLVFFIFSFIMVPEMTPDQRGLSALLFSLLAGFATIFMGGTVFLKITGDAGKHAKMAFSATAGIAVFAFTYKYTPYYFNQLRPDDTIRREALIEFDTMINVIRKESKQFLEQYPGEYRRVVQGGEDSESAKRMLFSKN